MEPEFVRSLASLPGSFSKIIERFSFLPFSGSRFLLCGNLGHLRFGHHLLGTLASVVLVLDSGLLPPQGTHLRVAPAD